MTCHKCNTPLPAGAKFCPNCAEPVPAVNATAAQIIDFSKYADERARHFTGREWVFKVVDDWLGKAGGSRYFLLTGEPGCGKTTIAAQIFRISRGKAPVPPGVTRIFPNLLNAAHFCSARDSTWIDPRIFARSVSLQLAGRFQEFSQALIETGEKATHMQAQVTAGVAHEHAVVAGFIINNLILAGGNSQEAFNRTVVEPLQTIFQKGFNQPMIILVDGLDESLHHRGDVSIPMLFSGLKSLPSQVRFILTSRRDPRVENELPDADTLFLSALNFEEHNRKDVRAYVDWRFKEDKDLEEVVTQAGPTKVSGSAETIAQKSEGNFRYVSFLLDAMAKGQRGLDDLEGIPAGLDGLYSDSLRRIVGLGKKDWASTYAPFLGVLSVAQSNLTAAQIKSFSGLPEGTVWGCLGDLQQFIEAVEAEKGKGEDQYRFYHQSVIDFLRSRQLNVEQKKLHNQYFLAQKEWHQRLAGFYLQKGPHSWMQWDEYGLRFVASHLAKAAQESTDLERHEMTEKLVNLVLDPDYQETHQRRLKDLISIQRDLRQALKSAAEDQNRLALPLVVRCALGLVNFRRMQLRPEPIFDLARSGDLEEAERRLSLFLTEREWEQAILLTIAWLASGRKGEEARKLCDRVCGTLPNFGPLPLLRDRVNAAILGTPSPPLPIPPAPPREMIRGMIDRLGGLGAEGNITESEVAETNFSEYPPGESVVGEAFRRGRSTYEESINWAGKQGELLVAYAAANPREGIEFLKQYQGILALNNYTRYRNRFLWALLHAVIRHPDQAWVLEVLSGLEAAALTGSKLEFQEGLPLALLALQAGMGTPGAIQKFEDHLNKARGAAAALSPGREQGDSWASHKRRLIALAEALNFLPDGKKRAVEILDQALGLPYGFAGFQAPACLTLAEAARICESGDPLIGAALAAAQRAAHNIQEPTFCAQTTARVNAMAERWWSPARFEVREMSGRLALDAGGPDFAALHIVGEPYLHRSPGNMSLPPWVREADTLIQLSLIYRRPQEEFQKFNPALDYHNPLPPGTKVNVPDPEFPALLAARFAAEALASTSLSDEEKVAVIQTLVPVATSNPTALDTVLSRLFPAARPHESTALEMIEKTIATSNPLPSPEEEKKIRGARAEWM
jgi:hypothetical protein